MKSSLLSVPTIPSSLRTYSCCVKKLFDYFLNRWRFYSEPTSDCVFLYITTFPDSKCMRISLTWFKLFRYSNGNFPHSHSHRPLLFRQLGSIPESGAQAEHREHTDGIHALPTQVKSEK